LTICRSIVQQHGGEISVVSEAGRGSTFTIAVPAGVPVEVGVQIPSKQKVIFICDDDEDTRNALRLFLSERGYGVEEMATGAELLEAATVRRPDAIILDLFMPDLNGWETLAQLKNDPDTSDVPIITVSVLSKEEQGAHATGLSGWLQKPLDEIALAEVIDHAFPGEKRRPRLMLVEDDPDLAAIIVASFERYGIETIHARDGREAIELASGARPDLLILDLILPGVDGYGVIDWLKDHSMWRGLPLVVYSATEPSMLQRERLRLGQTEFMTKSRVAPDEFERRIVALLDSLIAAAGGLETDVA
ncbi:MAG: response regulator, partial [Acidobacteriota bacterium]